MRVHKLYVAAVVVACALGTASAAVAASVGPQVGPAVSVGAAVGPAVGPGVTSGAAASVQESSWDYDEPCADCHASQVASFCSADETISDDEAPGDMDASREGADQREGRATELGTIHGAFELACKDCHADEDGLARAHAGATAELAEKRATRLRDTSIEADVCIACHGGAEALAGATSELDVLTDAQGLTVNPHAIPQNETHGVVDCSDCHKFHSDQETPTVAKDFCISCHHANVYACDTCHD